MSILKNDLLEEEAFLHLARRNKKVSTSDGSCKEYEAFVSFAMEDTIIGNPSPLLRTVCATKLLINNINYHYY